MNSVTKLDVGFNDKYSTIFFTEDGCVLYEGYDISVTGVEAMARDMIAAGVDKGTLIKFKQSIKDNTFAIDAFEAALRSVYINANINKLSKGLM